MGANAARTSPVLTTSPLQNRFLRMQHLQQQPHPGVFPDLLQESRSGHSIILTSSGNGLHLILAEEAHQHADELNLRKFTSWTVASATGPAYKRAIALGRLFEFLSAKSRGGTRYVSARLWIRCYPSRRLELEGVFPPVARMRV